MADTEDVIQLVIQADTSQGDRAKDTLAGVSTAVDTVAGQFTRARDAQGRFVSGMAEIQSQAQAATVAIQAQTQATQAATAAINAYENAARATPGAASVAGAAGRAGIDPAKAAARTRTFMFLANTAQDGIQGGPASTINNILGAAGDGGIKATLGEVVGLAGGLKGLAVGFGTVAAAAGAAFLVVGNGLKAHKLEWSDLGGVIDGIAGGAISGTFKNIGDTITATFAPLGELTNQALDYWLGWGEAAESVRAHKDEIENSTAAMAKLAESQKALGKFKSEAQDTKEDKEKRVGKEFAELGGEDGAIGLAKKLAGYRMAAAGEDPDSKAEYEYDEKYKEDGKEKTRRVKKTLTRREAAEVTATNDLADAIGGNATKRDGILGELDTWGEDTSRIRGTLDGRDYDKEKKDKEKKDKEAKDKQEKADKALDDRAKDLARPLEDRFNLSRAKGDGMGEQDIINELMRAGIAPAEAQDQGIHVWGKLNANYDDEIRERAGKKGLDAGGAAADLVAEHEAKAGKADKKKADDRADDLAKPLEDRYALARARGEGWDREGVRGELIRGGASTSEADAHADAVSAKLGESYDAEIRKRAGAKGLDVKGAEADLVADEDAKAKAKAKAAEDKRDREAIDQAKELTAGTGLNGQIDQALAFRALAGKGGNLAIAGVSDQVSAELQRKGMAKDEADVAAQDLVEKRSAKLNDDVMHRSDKDERLHAPERIDVGRFAQSVESAGADTQKKLLTVTEEVKNLLAQNLRANRGNRIGP